MHVAQEPSIPPNMSWGSGCCTLGQAAANETIHYCVIAVISVQLILKTERQVAAWD